MAVFDTDGLSTRGPPSFGVSRPGRVASYVQERQRSARKRATCRRPRNRTSLPETPMSAPTPKQSTIAVWGGETGHARYEHSTQVPVVHSVSFGYADLDAWQPVALGPEPGHIYSRISNPTIRASATLQCAGSRRRSASWNGR